MPHSNIDPITRSHAHRLRRELTKAEAAMCDTLRDFRPFGARFRREKPEFLAIAHLVRRVCARGTPMSKEAAIGYTPLCPAGHLPLKGGDRQAAPTPLHELPSRWAKPRHGLISPLEGEMSGRTEGGAKQNSGAYRSDTP